MPPDADSPLDLPAVLAALKRGEDWAAETVCDLLREKVERLVRLLLEQNRIVGRTDQLTERFLASALIWLKHHDNTTVIAVSSDLFAAAVMFFLARPLLTAPPGQPSAPIVQPELITSHNGFEFDGVFQPCESVSGDWFAFDPSEDGALWLLVTDVTGHGWGAHAVAAALPYLWQSTELMRLRDRSTSPAHVLESMSRELATCLPLGTFVEATLVRLESSGDVILSAAGDGRCVIRTAENSIRWWRFGALPLGLAPETSTPPEVRTQVASGDELLVASDGLFDQPIASERIGHQLLKLTQLPQPHDSLMSVVRDKLSQASSQHPQHDDIAVITMRFR